VVHCIRSVLVRSMAMLWYIRKRPTGTGQYRYLSGRAAMYNNGKYLYSAFHNVSMRFTISEGLFRAAYYGAIDSQAAYNHER
jgi:hypothetical protein